MKSRTRLARDVVDTFATQSGLAYDVTDTNCRHSRSSFDDFQASIFNKLDEKLIGGGGGGKKERRKERTITNKLCGAFIQKQSSIVTIFLSLTHSHVFVLFFSFFFSQSCASCTMHLPLGYSVHYFRFQALD